MKRYVHYLKSIIKSPIILAFVFVCVFLLPASINLSSIAFRSAIAVAIGIDVNNNDLFELQVAINVSSTSDSLAENSKVLSATGKTVGDAFSNLNMLFGRSVKLGHTRFVMIGNKISQLDIAKFLDRLIRTNKIRNTVQLVYCPDPIDKMFNVGVQLKSATGIKLSEIVCHQQSDSTTSIYSNIDSFFKGYLSPSGISKINTVHISDDYTKGISATADVGSEQKAQGEASQSGGGESASGGTKGASGGTQQEFISNTGDIAVYKNGLLKTVLSGDSKRGVNWISSDYNPKDLFVVVDEGTNKQMSLNFDIISKQVSVESFFYKGLPFVSAQIVVQLDIDEIIANHEIELNKSIVNEHVKDCIGKTIRRHISCASQVAKSEKLDLFNLNDIFYQKNYSDYKKYLAGGKNADDIIEETSVAVNIEIKVI